MFGHSTYIAFVCVCASCELNGDVFQHRQMCAFVWKRAYALMQSVFQRSSFSYHSSHMALTACAAGAWGSAGHEGVGSHLRPPVTKHSPSASRRARGKMSAGQPVLKLLLLLYVPASLSYLVSSVYSTAFLFTYLCVFNFCALYWHLYSPFKVLMDCSLDSAISGCFH